MKKEFIILSTLFLIISGCTLSPYDENVLAKDEKISYACFNEADTNNLYNSLINTNDTLIYQDNNYASYYFKYLNSNFGNNVYGTCTYVSIGMLMSFYDTYWNDAFIPEKYDKITEFESDLQLYADFEFPPFEVDSPGIAFESGDLVNNISIEEYYNVIERYSDQYFHLKLLSLSRSYFGNLKFDTTSVSLGMSYAEMIGFLNYYLYDYLSLTTGDVKINSENSDERTINEFVISNIKDGVPTILRATNGTSGHSFIAYDYDESTGEIFVHTGWRDELQNTALTHVSLSKLGYTTLWDATAIVPQTKHSHSFNFHSSLDEDICACNYIFPQNIEISGNYKNTQPTYKWKSLYKEKWFSEYNPYFKFSILDNSRKKIFSTSVKNNKSYTLATATWTSVLADFSNDSYYIYITLDSSTYSYWDEYWSIKLFSKPNEYELLPTINPSDYGFADAYPTDEETRSNFMTHIADGFTFETRRYRTGFIQGEYIVMSPIRSGITEAYIEYKFKIPVTQIDVKLAHWRSYSNEWLDSDTGTASIDALISGEWKQQLDLLSSSTSLPTDRSSPNLYSVKFEEPVYSFRIYSSSKNENINNDNRGRICIGDMTIYPIDEYLKVSDKSSSFLNAIYLNAGESVVESYQSVNDRDFYVYKAQYTNYIQFNIESPWQDECLSRIYVYNSKDLTNAIVSYTNEDAPYGDNLEYLPDIYAIQGETYYFEVLRISRYINYEVVRPFYYAKIYLANYADCTSDEFLSKGYVYDFKFEYNGSDNIYVYFDDSSYLNLDIGYTYRDIVLDAMKIWNTAGRKQLIEVKEKNKADIVIYSYYVEEDNRVGYYSFSKFDEKGKALIKGDLFLNKYYLQGRDYYYALSAGLHELGHGLGLSHIDYAGPYNVMYRYAQGTTHGKLGKGDLAVYNYLWK